MLKVTLSNPDVDVGVIMIMTEKGERIVIRQESGFTTVYLPDGTKADPGEIAAGNDDRLLDADSDTVEFTVGK